MASSAEVSVVSQQTLEAIEGYATDIALKPCSPRKSTPTSPQSQATTVSSISVKFVCAHCNGNNHARIMSHGDIPTQTDLVIATYPSEQAASYATHSPSNIDNNVVGLTTGSMVEDKMEKRSSWMRLYSKDNKQPATESPEKTTERLAKPTGDLKSRPKVIEKLDVSEKLAQAVGTSVQNIYITGQLVDATKEFSQVAMAESVSKQRNQMTEHPVANVIKAAQAIEKASDSTKDNTKEPTAICAKKATDTSSPPSATSKKTATSSRPSDPVAFPVLTPLKPKVVPKPPKAPVLRFPVKTRIEPKISQVPVSASPKPASNGPSSRSVRIGSPKAPSPRPNGMSKEVFERTVSRNDSGDIRNLTHQERMQLHAGPRVNIGIGGILVKGAPKHLLTAASPEAKKYFQDFPNTPTVFFPANAMSKEAVQHIVQWLDNMGTAPRPFSIPIRKDMADNLAVRRAARKLGMNAQVAHITKKYCNQIREQDMPSYQEMLLIETAATEDDPIMDCLTNRLALLRRMGRIPDEARFYRFLAEHPRIGSAIEAIDGRMNESSRG